MPLDSDKTPTCVPAHAPARWAELLESVCQCSRRLRRELTERLARHELGESHFSLLWACQQGPPQGINQNQLAAELALSPAQVSGLVEQLRLRGFLVLDRRATDRRQKLWRLTASGQQTFATILSDLEPWSRAVQQGLASTQIERLVTLLGQLSAASGAARRVAAAALVMFALWSLTWLTGCSPTYYRKQADADVEQLIDQKSCDPRWAIDDFTIDLDPRSRMFDPYDPDKEPIPPDDPTAHKLMHCVDGMCGDGTWHDNGDTPYTANPDWRQFVPYNDKGEFVMDLDTAIQVGLLNSTGYQRNLETLYLSALDVSFERFRFDVQFSNVTNLLFTSDGRLRNGTGVSSDTLELNNTFTAGGSGPQIGGKLFANGGELLVGIANSLVWQFSGNNTYTPTTLINFALFEPLLRGGGRARVLERLTRTERGLLSNIRQMEFYRESFYAFLTTGRDPGNGPSRQGGVFGGSGLEGFSGVGSGGFGGLAANTGGAAAGGTVAGGAGAADAGGYYGLLQDQQQIRNREANLAGLRDSLAQLEAIYQAGRIRRLQVDLAKQAIYTAESQLLTTRAAYDAGVENYLITLGLPPDLPVKIADPMLAPFELIDPAFPPLQRDLAQLQADAGDLIVPLREQSGEPRLQDDAAIHQVLSDPQFQQRWQALQQLLVNSSGRNSIGGVITATRNHFPSVQRDLQLFESRLNQRIDILKRQQSDEGVVPEEGEAETEEIRQLQGRPGQLRQRFSQIAKDLEAAPDLLARVDAEITWLLQQGPTATPEEFRQRIITQLRKDPAQFSRDPEGRELDSRYLYIKALLDAIPDRLGDLSQSVLNLSLVQAEARAESITLVPVEMQPEEALQIACKNRLDWMNARAALVDSWRLIAFNANDLESNLNLVFNGDISNTGRNPFDLNSATGRLSVGVQFEAPLTRLAQRNVYRQSLIEYQQSRRSYYQFVDRVNQGLRNTLRTIRLDQRNFELRRVAVRLAIDQVDQAREALRAPPKSGDLTNLGDTAAQDLVNALAALLNVQNDFLSVWLNYEVQRVTLDLLLGTMQLDERGMWIDPDHPTVPGRATGDCPSEPEPANSPEPEPLPAPSRAASALRIREQPMGEVARRANPPAPRGTPQAAPPVVSAAPPLPQAPTQAETGPPSAPTQAIQQTSAALPQPAQIMPKTPKATGQWKPGPRQQNGL